MGARHWSAFWLCVIAVQLAGCGDGLDGKPPPTGEVLRVDLGAPGPDHDGVTWGTAYLHPQDAVDAASAGDEVWVASGAYLRRTGTDTVLLSMKDGVSVYGGFAGTESARSARVPGANETVFDGEDQAYHVVVGASGATLDRFTVTGGSANGGAGPERAGAGVYCSGLASFTISGCIVTANAGTDIGAGVFAGDSTVAISDCVISGNSSPYGAGLHVTVNCTLVADRCVFASNTAGSQGGGLKTYGGTLLLKNCVFSANSANGQGGGAFVDTATARFVNCVFRGNSANSDAGGLHVNGSQAEVANCIFWDNSAPTGAEIDSNNTSTLTIAYSDVRGGWNGAQVDSHVTSTLVDGGGNINGDPLFANAADPDGPDDVWMTAGDGLAIGSGSPCVDAADGTTADFPAQDILGEDRHDDAGTPDTGLPAPNGNHPDMGAYEFPGS